MDHFATNLFLLNNFMMLFCKSIALPLQPSIFIPLYFHLYAYHVDFQDIQKQVDYSCWQYSGDTHILKEELRVVSVRSNNCYSNGLKSRPGSCPFTPVVQGSGV